MNRATSLVTVRAFDARSEYFDQPKIWLHAMCGEVVVGQCSIRIDAKEWAWINDLFVAEHMRRRGIAEQLLQNAKFSALLVKGAIGCVAGIDPANAASIALFKSAGYMHAYTWESNSPGDCKLFTRPFTEEECEY